MSSLEVLKDKFNKLTKGEGNALHNLKNDKTVVIKGTDKVSAVRDREENSTEAENQLGDTNIHGEVSNDAKPFYEHHT